MTLKNNESLPKSGLPAPAIRAENLRKTYGELTAVDGISFQVRTGTIHGLLGPNGAGKTTIMRMLSGLLPPDSGTIEVCGYDAKTNGREVRRHLGIVTQSDGLNDSVVVERNLTIFGHICGLSWKDSKSRAMDALRLMGLEARANSDTWQLSGGMKRRLAIARAMMTNPDVVIFDEPTTGLDPHSRNTVWEQLHRMRDRGVTILMSTHYMEEAASICSRISIVNHGRILAEGEPTELIKRYAGERVAVVEAPAERVAEQKQLIKASGATVIGNGMITRVLLDNGTVDFSTAADVKVTVRAATLEDVFLILSGRTLEEVVSQ